VVASLQTWIAALAKKSVAVELSHYQSLMARLEFCDLRELHDAISSKSLWGPLETRFRNKETLFAKFGQLADIRNVIRHGRSLGSVLN
jgi:hypothetical protein